MTKKNRISEEKFEKLHQRTGLWVEWLVYTQYEQVRVWVTNNRCLNWIRYIFRWQVYHAIVAYFSYPMTMLMNMTTAKFQIEHNIK